MKTKFKLVLLSGLVVLSSVLCSLTSPRVEKSTPDAVAAEEQAKAAQLTPGAATAPVQPAQQEAPAQTGGIAGTLSYPSEGIPPLRVVAFASDGSGYYAVEVSSGNTFILKDVPAGQYTVVAYPLEKGGDLAGGYSNFVLCGLSVECGDHSLVIVTVEPGQVTGGVQPADWYAPPGTFPQDPTVQ